jgi:amino acid transporter
MFSSEKKEASIGSKAVQDVPYSHSSSPSSISQDDVEGSPVPGTTVQLKRRLQSRHLQMIAIGMGTAFCSCHRTKL